MSCFSALFGLLATQATVDGARARKLVGEGAQLVDVRTPGEFAGGALPGAKNIPVDGLAGRLGEIDPKRPVIVYCRSGMRSSKAAAMLTERGYTVHDLGAIGNWTATEG
jgi:phage shock protein E